MENWEQKFDHAQLPDGTVSSHRDGLRRKLESAPQPSHRPAARSAAMAALAAIFVIGGLTIVFPSWAKGLWNTVFVQTITFHSPDGHTVVIKKLPADQCAGRCDTACAMKIIQCNDRRTLSFEANIEKVSVNGDSSETITISTPDCEKTWIVNGDTVDAKEIMMGIEPLSDLNSAPDASELRWESIAGSDAAPAVSADFELHQNYPNPFNPTTQISFDLNKSGPVTLKVYNLMGQEIATLLNGYSDAGHHTVTFDGANLPSGTYLYTLKTADYQFSKMMVLEK